MRGRSNSNGFNLSVRREERTERTAAKRLNLEAEGLGCVEEQPVSGGRRQARKQPLRREDP